jgi:hypothetical protein
MNTTVTFRVADGMLVENAREQRPDADKYEDNTSGLKKYRKDIEKYTQHLASLRSIPIAPGATFEGDALKEDIDFWIGCECDRQGRRGIACLCFCCYGKKAYPVEKELKVALIDHAMQWVDVLPLPENPSSKHWRDCVLDFPLTWSEAEQRIENGLPETVQYLAPAPLTYTPAQVIEMVRKGYEKGISVMGAMATVQPKI